LKLTPHPFPSPLFLDAAVGFLLLELHVSTSLLE
jgi:hypothetical protein